jgi:ubiquinol-cytochrome c reductase cytochrome b subunit
VRIYAWLDERIDLVQLRRALLDRAVPDRLTWWHTLGSATLTVFLVQIVTGVVLATYYAGSPDHAYDSIQYLQAEIRGGALVRSVHHWGSSAMVLLVLAHMVRVFTMGAYKYPREINWLIGVLLFLLVMGFGFTGYLLPWDQKAYWATQVGTNIAGTVPFIGGALVKLLRGGTQLGAATLTRFYAFHVLWLPLFLGGLVLLHLALVIRQGIAPAPQLLEAGAPKHTSLPAYREYYRRGYAASKGGSVRFWPDVIGKDAFVSFVVVGLLVLLAVLAPAGLEPPADPTDTSYVPRPEWYFLPFYQLLKLVPGSLEAVIAAGIPALLVVALLMLPFFDYRSTRHLLHRPVALASLLFLLGGASLLLGAAARSEQPTTPAEVGRPLSSVERAGRAIYQQQGCGSCHTMTGVPSADGPPDLQNIGARHSAAWLHSFLEHPERFHPGSAMPAFGPPVLTHQEVEELSQYLASLRGPPGKPLPVQVHDTFPDRVP